jgi:hypothetical protein
MLGIKNLLTQIQDPQIVALAETSDEVDQFRKRWPEDGPPLLLIRCPAHSAHNMALEAVVEMSNRRPDGGVAVLLLDGPELSGYQDKNRQTWNRSLAGALEARILDVQVFEYSPSWASSPPRPR